MSQAVVVPGLKNGTARATANSPMPVHSRLRGVNHSKGGAFSVVSPVIAPATHQGSDRINVPLDPLPTVTDTGSQQ
jgi:DNA (cytosine-5)-methyltransferase 1